MPHNKPLIENSLTKVVAICHCPIGEAFHKVAFYMTTDEWFDFHESESATCQSLLH